MTHPLICGRCVFSRGTGLWNLPAYGKLALKSGDLPTALGKRAPAPHPAFPTAPTAPAAENTVVERDKTGSVR